MRKDFYIFRHGETDYNREQRIQGCGLDAPLNEVGIAQAEELAKKLRALQTAQICAGHLGVAVDVIPELREGCFGELEGMLKTEVAVKYAEIHKDWYSPVDDMNVRFPGGESKQEMQDRMFAVISSLLSSPFQIIGIASHGSSIRYLLYKFGLSPHRMPNTALYHVVCEDGNWRLI